MNKILQIILIISTCMFCLFILSVTRKKKLSYKYTLLWLLFGIITLICAVFPSLVANFANLIHIIEPANALFLIYIFLLIVIIFYMSCALSKMHEKITKLIQENAILNYKLEKISKEKGENNENN